MKELFNQFPQLFEQLMKKVEEAESHGRPEVKEAGKKLMQTMRQTTQELAILSNKFGKDPKPTIKPRIPAKLKKRKEAQQLSFDFMNDNNTNNTA